MAYNFAHPLPFSRKSDRQSGRWPFWLAIFFSLLPIGAGPEGTTDGSGLRQVMLTFFFASALFYVVTNTKKYQIAFQSISISFLFLLLYITASAIWSPQPVVSAKRVIQVYGVSLLYVAVLVGSNGKATFSRTVAPILSAGAVLTILFSALFPDAAYDNIAIGFKGFMSTKNTFSQFAVFCILVPIYIIYSEKNRNFFYISLCAAGAIFLATSLSVTAMSGLCIVGLYYMLSYFLSRIHPSWKIPGLLFLISALASLFAILIYLGIPSIETILSAIVSPTGKDLTLSGRTYLWELMLNQAFSHPWFGTGYGGFWLGLEGMSGQIAYLVRWGYPGQAHNGYIDLFNELGVIGCILVLAFIAQHIYNIKRVRTLNPGLASFHAAILALILIENFAEATFLRTTHLWWMLFAGSVAEVTYLSSTINKTKNIR